MYNDPFTILEVSASASIDEIHAAFRKKARQHHPDLGGDRQKFQELTEAYEELIRRKENEQTDNLRSPLEPPPQSTARPFTSSEPTSRPVRSKKKKPSKPPAKSSRASDARHILTGKLPLQDETTYFILVNALDIFLTYSFFIKHWGIPGMITYKMGIVALVCVIAQIVALSSLRKASRLLNFGTVFMTCVVIYSVWLLAR